MTIEAIKAATQEDLAAVSVIDSRTAESVYRYFHPEESPSSADEAKIEAE